MAILHFNTMQNSSSKFSPFEIAYGIRGNTALDNVLGVDNRQVRDPPLVRENVVANKADARASYQSQKNKTIKLNDYKVGDLVLLKRTH